jgi:hypothetical protein
LDATKRDKLIYKIKDKKRDLDEAMELAKEYDYNLSDGKIPIGIFYQTQRKTLEENWPQLKSLKNKGIGWKDLKK